MNNESAVLIVTENNIPREIILVPNGHEDDRAEKAFIDLCESVFNHTPTEDDLDNGYIEFGNVSASITWPEVQEVELCEECGAIKKSFVHNCSGSSNMPEIFGCPKCDDTCAFCKED